MNTAPSLPDGPFRCFLVKAASQGPPQGAIVERSLKDLPSGEITIRVRYSSLNYKDAMAAQGHKGVAPNLPHVPGIDAAGVVVANEAAATEENGTLTPGSQVLVTGYELGTTRWGGWSEYIRVPAAWVVPLPAGLSLKEAMALGTAGFTAAQCVGALEKHGVLPGGGVVAVSGASGGVGSLAVAILAKLGYQVAASTGKQEMHAQLEELGASEILDRAALTEESTRPLLSTRWAGAVDTVGGATLATLLRSTEHRGCVAACGLVGGAELPITVYPFILRGVTLAGIDSAQCPAEPRREIWRKLADAWKPAGLAQLASECTLADLPERIEAILAGRSHGRVVVDMGG